MIDQYAEDGCEQHRTEHHVDRFKMRSRTTSELRQRNQGGFKSRTSTGSKFSMLRYGIRS